MRETVKETETYFHNGGLNCAETTLRLLIEQGVIDAPIETVRMMTGFGGGMQRGTTCGAVIGAVAAIGWVTGRTEPDAPREPSGEAVRVFLQRFEEKFRVLDCDALQVAYVQDYALKSDGMYRSCCAFVETAVRLTEEILKDANGYEHEAADRSGDRGGGLPAAAQHELRSR